MRTRTCIHRTHLLTCIHPYAHVRMHMNACMHACMHTHIHAQIHMYVHTRSKLTRGGSYNEHNLFEVCTNMFPDCGREIGKTKPR